jgi:GntR family transcriptional regulator/MocR family aminotransferase
MRASAEVTIPLRIDRFSRSTVRDQLREQLRGAILTGALHPGDPLPSTRRLAEHTAVARGTVVAVYDELAGEGIVEAVAGSGTIVTAQSLGGDRKTATPLSEPTPDGARMIDLRPGHPSNARLPHPDWNAAWRAALSEGIPSTYPPLAGERVLRVQIAEHLRTARGLDCDPAEIIVTAGTTEALALIFAALAERARATEAGPAALAIEDPGYPAVRRLAARAGLTAVPIAVDDDGMSVDRLRLITEPMAAAVVTPSHQYPLGGRLHINSRLALLSWATDTGSFIIEDDYDSEFRHVGAPLPSIASLDSDQRVLHIGSFSKVLVPDLRCGYVVVQNPEMRAAVLAVRSDLDMPVAGVVQRALAHYLASGGLRRHIARVRRDYSHKRGIVNRFLGDLAPDVRLGGLDGGLHAVVRFPSSRPAATVVRDLLHDGVTVAELSDYAVSEPSNWNGLVIGYGSPTDLELTAALERIRAHLS